LAEQMRVVRADEQSLTRHGASRSSMQSLFSSSSFSKIAHSTWFTDFPELSNHSYPATELIKCLVDVLGYNVTCIRRNKQVSYILVDRARNVCDQINWHIQDADSKEDWSSYEQLTKAIKPVEGWATHGLIFGTGLASSFGS
jgi:hypothetical protein